MKSNKKQNVQYENNSLVITIPTACPELTHELLMKGISVCLRQNLTSTDKRKDDEDSLVALTDLLQSLIPTEEMLLKAS